MKKAKNQKDGKWKMENGKWIMENKKKGRIAYNLDIGLRCLH